MIDQNCQTCNGPTSGYKCTGCGEESEVPSSEHTCGGQCQPKCEECSEAQENCVCDNK